MQWTVPCGKDDVGKQGADEHHGEGQGDDEDEVDQLALELEVHKEEGDEAGLDRGDGEGEKDLDPFFLNIEEGDADGDDGEDHQEAEDRKIIYLVMRQGLGVAVGLGHSGCVVCHRNSKEFRTQNSELRIRSNQIQKWE